MSSLFGEARHLTEFGVANCQLEYERSPLYLSKSRSICTLSPLGLHVRKGVGYSIRREISIALLHTAVSRARLQNTHAPLLESLAWSNRMQIEYAYEIIAQAVHSKEDTIGFLGLSFKVGTDDLRESPMVELVERFIGKGYRLLLYDKYVSLTRLMGTNKQYIQQEIPHLAELMAEDVAHVLRMSKVLVVVNRKGPYGEVLGQTDSGTRIICLEDILSGHTQM